MKHENGLLSVAGSDGVRKGALPNEIDLASILSRDSSYGFVRTGTKTGVFGLGIFVKFGKRLSPFFDKSSNGLTSNLSVGRGKGDFLRVGCSNKKQGESEGFHIMKTLSKMKFVFRK